MFFKYNVWGIIWILIILIACSTPGDKLPEGPFLNFDKLIHFFFYGMLQLLVLRGLLLQHQFKFLRKNYLLVSFIFSSFYGILIEILQGYVFRNRSLDTHDMIANVIGVLLATIAWILLFRKKMMRKVH